MLTVRSMQINRIYWSITVGVPLKESGEVCTNIGRHPSDRLRMAVYGFGSSRGREAVSTYKRVPHWPGHHFHSCMVGNGAVSDLCDHEWLAQRSRGLTCCSSFSFV